MAGLYHLLYRLVLARIDPERAHGFALAVLRGAQRAPAGLRALSRFAAPPDARLASEHWGLTFPNPLGVAAGMDKNAQVVPALFALGFGHVEVGTVTPQAQPGNACPRLWRVVEQGALINALGFPSDGAEPVLSRLSGAPFQHARAKIGSGRVLGVNLGKNRNTPLEQAHRDYASLIETLMPVAQYFVLNVSSPNTPGLRDLQVGRELMQLLRVAIDANREAAARQQTLPRPLLVKLSPDLSVEQLEEIADAAIGAGVHGLIATNTTIERSNLDPQHRGHPGGLSGVPLRDRARRVIALLYRTVGGRVPIVGVGGVASASDALKHIGAGASLVQMYTGFVYGGPALPGRIVREMSTVADREGWTSIRQIVGREADSPENVLQ